jgi:DNA-binding LytR/AlgR family response regulator
LRAFEVHALDYLLKPVDDERFGSAHEFKVCSPTRFLRVAF